VWDLRMDTVKQPWFQVGVCNNGWYR
jgi:hypothetical protein